jgi:uncharacterized protein (TIGR02271 family)
MTTRTLTAMFDSRVDAEQAQRKLGELGISQANIRLIDPGADGGTAITEPRGMWARLKDLFVPDEDREIFAEGIRRGSSLLVTQVDESEVDRAVSVLEQCNAVDLQQRQTQWQQAGWSATAPQPMGIEGEEVIPVVEEQLRVGKREVHRGGVRVRSYIVEEPVQQDVRLREERVQVERRPVDQPAAPGAKQDLLRERTVEMRETGEEAVVQKDTVVKEEVAVSKRAEERVERVEDTLRHTEVEIDEDQPDTRGTQRPKPGRTDSPRQPRH